MLHRNRGRYSCCRGYRHLETNTVQVNDDHYDSDDEDDNDDEDNDDDDDDDDDDHGDDIFGEQASRAAGVGHHWITLQCVNTAHNGLLNPWIGFCFQLQLITHVCFNQHVHKLIGIKSIVDSWIPEVKGKHLHCACLPTQKFSNRDNLLHSCSTVASPLQTASHTWDHHEVLEYSEEPGPTSSLPLQVVIAENTRLKAEVGTFTSENMMFLKANKRQLRTKMEALDKALKYSQLTELEDKMAQAVSTAVEPAGEG
ncbi:hypothetical protein EMCRGX_G007964 [Ephydatia muelleri]